MPTSALIGNFSELILTAEVAANRLGGTDQFLQRCFPVSRINLQARQKNYCSHCSYFKSNEFALVDFTHSHRPVHQYIEATALRSEDGNRFEIWSGIRHTTMPLPLFSSCNYQYRSPQSALGFVKSVVDPWM